MFGQKRSIGPGESDASRRPAVSSAFIEALEDRRMLSASAAPHAVRAHAVHHATAKHVKVKHAVTKAATKAAAKKAAAATTPSASTTTASIGTTVSTGINEGGIVDTIQFTQAPSLVQTGLTTLAAKDGLAVPMPTQTVSLGNSNGVLLYTLNYTATGTTTQITVDAGGNAVTAPTQGTTTWATLSGTGTGSDAAAATEISAIVTALGLTAPTTDTVIKVSTSASGVSTYTIELAGPTSTSEEAKISVDSNGNPVGRQSLPFSALPVTVRDGLNSHRPTGATALPNNSTQNVDVLTENGLTFYSTVFTFNGTTSTVTVNSGGDLATLPGTTSTTFSAIPLATQMELQKLATAAGVSAPISAGQVVTAYNEGNGTTIYSVTLSATDSASQTISVTVAADQLGNPPVPPDHRGGCGGGGGQGEQNGFDNGGVELGLASFGGYH